MQTGPYFTLIDSTQVTVGEVRRIYAEYILQTKESWKEIKEALWERLSKEEKQKAAENLDMMKDFLVAKSIQSLAERHST